MMLHDDERKLDLYAVTKDGEATLVAALQNLTSEEDLVMVVRCEHCIYNIRNTDSVPEDWCYKHGIDIDYDDYCSFGEKNEEEQR